MKRVIGYLALFLSISVLMPEVGFSQKKKASARKKNTNRKGNTPTVAEAPPAPVVDSTAILAAQQQAMDSTTRAGLVPKAVKSMRPGTTVIGDLVAEKTPLAYDILRIDDQVYKQVLIKDIMIYEKMNQFFHYEGEDDNGSQSFFFILLQHIRDGDVTAFSADNDRFTTPLTISDIAKDITGTAQTIEVPDMDQDPDGTKGIMKTVTIVEEFDLRSIVGFRIKQEVIFDRETSTMQFRTLGIAPIKEKDFLGGKAVMPMFWVYYPDVRPFLAKHEAYNPKNMAMRTSWEDIFESRYYSSVIVKSTLNNPRDVALRAYIPDPIHRLLEGENIKNTIFDWEQDQWSY